MPAPGKASRERRAAADDELRALLADYTDDELAAIVEMLPPAAAEELSRELASSSPAPKDPLAQALERNDEYLPLHHLVYLAGRLAKAFRDARNGIERKLVISMPPRSGKTQLTSKEGPVWMLRQAPEWSIGLVSYSPDLARTWSREIRRAFSDDATLGIELAKDAGAVEQWQTTKKGGIIARSAPGQSLTGQDFDVLIYDDLVKDYATAHSALARKALWDWWLSNAQTRHAKLTIVIGTRWHQDDVIGRILSKEHEGDPEEWEVISFPAVAEKDDVLGRAEGDPLESPYAAGRDRETLVAWWAKQRKATSPYAWAALYQQRPSPASGAIFSTDWWRYWTVDPSREVSDSVVYLEPELIEGGEWLDSWDAAFKGSESSDFIVGQRWVRTGPNRFLIMQSRDRRTFTETLAEMTRFFGDGPGHLKTTRHLIEDKANGPAIIDVLKETFSGIKPINPKDSKEARAHAVTPEIESGHVYLPHPADPGNEWVLELQSELRDFPSSAHDDQVDALTQALLHLQDEQVAMMSNPSKIAAGRKLGGFGRPGTGVPGAAPRYIQRYGGGSGAGGRR